MIRLIVSFLQTLTHSENCLQDPSANFDSDNRLTGEDLFPGRLTISSINAIFQ